MRKIGFAFSLVAMMIDFLTIIIAFIISAIMPKIGLAAYQLSSNSKYHDNGSYFVDFTYAYIIAAILILVGFIFAIWFYKKES
ncbi:MAG: hypothetical protein PHD66_00875 [Eubacteriales bacterium]|nr:hypothetical protein [Eubacteriales bacterium]